MEHTTQLFNANTHIEQICEFIANFSTKNNIALMRSVKRRVSANTEQIVKIE